MSEPTDLVAGDAEYADAWDRVEGAIPTPHSVHLAEGLARLKPPVRDPPPDDAIPLDEAYLRVQHALPPIDAQDALAVLQDRVDAILDGPADPYEDLPVTGEDGLWALAQDADLDLDWPIARPDLVDALQEAGVRP